MNVIGCRLCRPRSCRKGNPEVSYRASSPARWELMCVQICIFMFTPASDIKRSTLAVSIYNSVPGSRGGEALEPTSLRFTVR